ncbi:MAG: hypothetical protein ACKOFQ_04965 [Candidatus Nanopelagicus sp.]|jgi:hypothetical protein
MIIDCESCVMRDIACGDCVVSVLLQISPAPVKKAELSNTHAAAINNLAKVGLVPPLRFTPSGKGQGGRKKTG